MFMYIKSCTYKLKQAIEIINVTHFNFIPEVRVTIEAHDAESAASREATFWRDTSSVFCFHLRAA